MVDYILELIPSFDLIPTLGKDSDPSYLIDDSWVMPQSRWSLQIF
jgi:hypothetical protein